MSSTSRIEIDLSAIEQNVALIRQTLAAHAPPDQPRTLCAVLKADAYGLGAARIAKRLEIAGVDMCAVYTPHQARELLHAAIRLPILILSPVREFSRDDPLYRAASLGKLHFTIHDFDQLDSLSHMADHLGIVLPVHIEVDTGLHRAGSPPTDAVRIVEIAAKHPRLRIAGLSTHFASADCDAEQTSRQADAFDAWLDHVTPMTGPETLIHIANSCALFRSSAYHRGLVRVGIGLYGYVADRYHDPDSCELIEPCRELIPVVRWTSHVVHLINAPKGDPVGYAGTWKAMRDTRLALIPVGFADGYPLSLSNRGTVGVELPDNSMIYCPVAGRVSMDQFTIDITDMPPGSVIPGTCVELVGLNKSAPTHLPALAQAAGSSTLEMLTRLGPRVQRDYLAVPQQRHATVSAKLTEVHDR
jgi:alanine racemase